MFLNNIYICLHIVCVPTSHFCKHDISVNLEGVSGEADIKLLVWKAISGFYHRTRLFHSTQRTKKQYLICGLLVHLLCFDLVLIPVEIV